MKKLVIIFTVMLCIMQQNAFAHPAMIRTQTHSHHAIRSYIMYRACVIRPIIKAAKPPMIISNATLKQKEGVKQKDHKWKYKGNKKNEQVK